MSSFRDLIAAVSLVAAAATVGTALAQTGAFPGIGRAATPKEVAAWDIDVRPDFKGLPAGSGSVEKGMDVWESKCSSCHGVFGESNQVFTPLVGGTTKDDVKTGRAARLTDPAYPGRTTMMKVATISTLWDYIHRAMPWNAPKSLTPDEVYAVTAYLLNLADVVPADYVLSDKNIAQAQSLLPNRNGMTTDHGLWPGKGFGNGGKPDVKAKACMKDCAAEPSVASFLPDFARDAHGNLSQQNRLVGAQHGVDTSKPPGSAATSRAPAAAPTPAPAAATAATAATTPRPTAAAAAAAPTRVLQEHNCLTCHGVDRKVVGPALQDVAKKYASRSDAADYLSRRIREGGSGVWGPIPMPPQTVGDADLKAIVDWLSTGAAR